MKGAAADGTVGVASSAALAAASGADPSRPADGGASVPESAVSPTTSFEESCERLTG